MHPLVLLLLPLLQMLQTPRVLRATRLHPRTTLKRMKMELNLLSLSDSLAREGKTDENSSDKPLQPENCSRTEKRVKFDLSPLVVHR
jgi:hypothetical protein